MNPALEDESDDDPVRLSPGRKDDDEVDITPMIDITFLLLIFFVVASKMDPTQTGRIPPASNGLSVSAKDSAVIFISRAIARSERAGAPNSAICFQAVSLMVSCILGICFFLIGLTILPLHLNLHRKYTVFIYFCQERKAVANESNA